MKTTKLFFLIAVLAVGAVQATAQFALAPTNASLPKNPFGGTVSTPYGTGSYTYSNGTYRGGAGGNPSSR